MEPCLSYKIVKAVCATKAQGSIMFDDAQEEVEKLLAPFESEIDTLRTEVASLKHCYKLLEEERERVQSQLKIATDALEYASWPGPDRDFWDRVDNATEALAKIQEMGKNVT